MCINRRRTIECVKRVFSGEGMIHEKPFDVQKRIRDLMDASGISSYKLARACDVSSSTVTRWLSPDAKLTTESVQKIANAFDLTVAQFFNEEFVDRRGDGPSKRLRVLWKTLTEGERNYLVDTSEVMMTAARPYIKK